MAYPMGFGRRPEPLRSIGRTRLVQSPEPPRLAGNSCGPLNEFHCPAIRGHSSFLAATALVPTPAAVQQARIARQQLCMLCEASGACQEHFERGHPLKADLHRIARRPVASVRSDPRPATRLTVGLVAEQSPVGPHHGRSGRRAVARAVHRREEAGVLSGAAQGGFLVE